MTVDYGPDMYRAIRTAAAEDDTNVSDGFRGLATVALQSRCQGVQEVRDADVDKVINESFTDWCLDQAEREAP